MKLILARHGNTFAPGEPARWVGRNEDLPLVESGITQAKILGQSLKHHHVSLRAIYAGPLQRTRTYADIISNTLKIPCDVMIDERLNEIDYGDWRGLTTDEVRARYGNEGLEQWELRSEYPPHAHWTPSTEAVIHAIQSFAQELTQHYPEDDTLLIVSSNGCLRYFLTLIPDAFQQFVNEKRIKMATGHMSVLTHDTHTGWRVESWNQPPHPNAHDQ